MTALSVYAIVLAAGRGVRFGGDKLLAELRGRPLLAHVLDVVIAAREQETLAGGLVVLRPGEPRLEQAATRTGLERVHNHAPDAELSGSLKLALAELAARHDDVGAALIFAGDQPAVRVSVATAIVKAWRNGGGPVIRPRYLEQPDAPGHPVLFDRSVWTLARELSGDIGFGPMLRRFPAMVTLLDVPGTNPDIDTPGDLARLAETP